MISSAKSLLPCHTPHSRILDTWGAVILPSMPSLRREHASLGCDGCIFSPHLKNRSPMNTVLLVLGRFDSA